MTAERKPRAFGAMRDDRVRDMARRTFGREFGSKAEAVKALSGLPVEQQHALKKRGDPSRPVRGRSNWAPAEMRGGIGVPTAAKMQAASTATLQRYLRATTGIEAKSRAQSLTLLSKFGPTEVGRAAAKAYAGHAHDVGGRWRDSDLKDIPAKPVPRAPAPPAPSLSARLASGTARTFGAIRSADRLGNWVLAGTAARQGYERARGEGRSQRDAALAGARDAALPLALASSRMIASATGAAADRVIAAAKSAQAGEAASKSPLVKAALTRIAGAGNEVGAVLNGVRAVARFAPVIGLGIATVKGAGDDERWYRGAARGLVTAYDPSAILMGRGVVERGFDRLFGRSKASLQREASIADRKTGLARLDGGQAVATMAPAVMAARAAAPAYKDTWTDKNGKTYTRRDTSVRSAG